MLRLTARARVYRYVDISNMHACSVDIYVCAHFVERPIIFSASSYSIHVDVSRSGSTLDLVLFARFLLTRVCIFDRMEERPMLQCFGGR